jgi:hypothetical protein
MSIFFELYIFLCKKVEYELSEELDVRGWIYNPERWGGEKKEKEGKTK